MNQLQIYKTNSSTDKYGAPCGNVKDRTHTAQKEVKTIIEGMVLSNRFADQLFPLPEHPIYRQVFILEVTFTNVYIFF